MKKTLSLLLFLLASASVFSQPVAVTIVTSDNIHYQMMRAGEPFVLKGGAGSSLEFQKEMSRRGGNSIRTWGVDSGSKTLLDSALANGLTVSLGLWVGRESEGFNYDDSIAVLNQLNSFRNIVLQYKDHPALLAWGIGNEVEINASNMKVYNAINDLSKMIHDVDGNHPTYTATAMISTNKANIIAERAPDLDFLGVNAYGGIVSVYNSIAASNFKKPYILTEWGVNGPWEVSKTSFGSPLEQTSASKAASVKQRYEQYISPYIGGRCLGSYAFLWGFKTEATKTWFGLFVGSETTEMIDVLEYEWTGSWNANRAPSISSLKVNNIAPENSLVISHSDGNLISVTASNPEGDPLSYEFLILPESGTSGVVSMPGATFDALPGIITNINGNTANLRFTLAGNLQNYRLYAFARDGKGHVSSASFPLRTQLTDQGAIDWEFSAIKDAYVRGGIYENTNFGNTDPEVLVIKRSAIPDSTRQIYLQFDLTTAPPEFEKVWLECYGSTKVDAKIQVLSAGTASWNESEINWLNKPSSASGTLSGSVISGNEDWYRWDLTNYIKGQLNSNKHVLNFILIGNADNQSEPVIFKSSETSNGPKIVFSTSNGLKTNTDQLFNIYPNPAEEILYLEFGKNLSKNRQLKIYSSNSQLVRIINVPDGIEKMQTDIRNFQPGLYFVIFENSHGMASPGVRFVKY
ncbi:MAG: DNRLRE domain-containing protein [Bacteroidales bacterium]|nr:DNRLRE domain-containing protein [Bacteroidales bacterium]MCB9012830.1 DNRLRE domain-containing protein [Bacteroidales bacterium]